MRLALISHHAPSPLFSDYILISSHFSLCQYHFISCPFSSVSACDIPIIPDVITCLASHLRISTGFLGNRSLYFAVLAYLLLRHWIHYDVRVGSLRTLLPCKLFIYSHLPRILCSFGMFSSEKRVHKGLPLIPDVLRHHNDRLLLQ